MKYLFVFLAFIPFLSFGQENYLFEHEASRLRNDIHYRQQQINQDNAYLKQAAIIPDSVYNGSLTLEHNKQVYLMSGDSLGIIDSAYVEYRWFYREQWSMNSWAVYDTTLHKNMLHQHKTIIKSSVAWFEIIFTFCYFLVVVLLFILFRNKVAVAKVAGIAAAVVAVAVAEVAGIAAAVVAVAVAGIAAAAAVVAAKYIFIVFPILSLIGLGVVYFVFGTPVFFVPALVGTLVAFTLNIPQFLEKKNAVNPVEAKESDG